MWSASLLLLAICSPRAGAHRDAHGVGGQLAAEEATAADIFYQSCKKSQGSCSACMTGVPQNWRKRDLILGPFVGPSYRCVWKHTAQEEYPFLKAGTQEEAIDIIKADPDQWCPIAAYMARDWSGTRMNAVQQFECVEEFSDADLGAFSVALPKGQTLSDAEKEHFDDNAASEDCRRSYAAAEAFMEACSEKNQDEEGRYVTVPSCQKYQQLLLEAWEQSGEGQEELALPDISAAVRLANQRLRKLPKALEAAEQSPVMAGLHHLCGKFGHRYMDSVTGKIFDHFPVSSELTGRSTSQAALIRRQLEVPFQQMVAEQAKEKFCKPQDPSKVCTSGLGGMNSELLCKAWVNCMCGGKDTESQEIGDVGDFLADLPWRGGGEPWQWREGQGMSAFSKYEEKAEWASQIIVHRETGELYLGDGHHRLMYAKARRLRAWADSKCE